MKQHPNQKPRPRGRTPNQQQQQQRKGNGSSRNQTFDSNGPSIRIRGSAHQVMEKYLALARDAAGQGDRVLAENYLQHAEHYFRIIQNSQPRPPRVLNPAAADGADGPQPEMTDEDGDDEAAEAADEATVEVIRPAAPEAAETEEPESVAV
ncbi:DUF4167 domain-containing protein [Oleispirillum naphthae]|uniref:DUF4167 domain-containing protein n=1 Tax=Oleispirillum naphthae TaxID=2838853 RepID=UPI00308224F7